ASAIGAWPLSRTQHAPRSTTWKCATSAAGSVKAQGARSSSRQNTRPSSLTERSTSVRTSGPVSSARSGTLAAWPGPADRSCFRASSTWSLRGKVSIPPERRSDRRMILVTGATGTNGRLVVHALLKAGQPVRAMVQDPALAGDLGQAGAQLVAADFD